MIIELLGEFFEWEIIKAEVCSEEDRVKEEEERVACLAGEGQQTGSKQQCGIRTTGAQLWDGTDV